MTRPQTPIAGPQQIRGLGIGVRSMEKSMFKKILSQFKLKDLNKGFTLLELIVAIGIFVLIAGSAVWLIINGFRYNRVVWNHLESQNDGRRAVREVVDVVRRAEESSLGGFAIKTAGDYELTIYANEDEDDYVEQVRFFLDGTDFKKGVIKPVGSPLSYVGEEVETLLARNVVNESYMVPLFLYYDSGYNGAGLALTQPVDITTTTAVRVQLEIEKDPDESPVPLHVESLVSVRNLKNN